MHSRLGVGSWIATLARFRRRSPLWHDGESSRGVSPFVLALNRLSVVFLCGIPSRARVCLRGSARRGLCSKICCRPPPRRLLAAQKGLLFSDPAIERLPPFEFVVGPDMLPAKRFVKIHVDVLVRASDGDDVGRPFSSLEGASGAKKWDAKVHVVLCGRPGANFLLGGNDEELDLSRESGRVVQLRMKPSGNMSSSKIQKALKGETSRNVRFSIRFTDSSGEEYILRSEWVEVRTKFPRGVKSVDHRFAITSVESPAKAATTPVKADSEGPRTPVSCDIKAEGGAGVFGGGGVGGGGEGEASGSTETAGPSAPSQMATPMTGDSEPRAAPHPTVSSPPAPSRVVVPTIRTPTEDERGSATPDPAAAIRSFLEDSEVSIGDVDDLPEELIEMVQRSWLGETSAGSSVGSAELLWPTPRFPFPSVGTGHEDGQSDPTPRARAVEYILDVMSDMFNQLEIDPSTPLVFARERTV